MSALTIEQIDEAKIIIEQSAPSLLSKLDKLSAQGLHHEIIARTSGRITVRVTMPLKNSENIVHISVLQKTSDHENSLMMSSGRPNRVEHCPYQTTGSRRVQDMLGHLLQDQRMRKLTASGAVPMLTL
jgi:hypothetical protein